MGADVLAGSVLYMVAIYHRMFYVAALFAAFDVAYYGPQMLIAPAAAFAAAAAML